MVAFVAARMPGLGDPMKLHIDIFFGCLKAYCDAERNAPGSIGGPRLG